MPQPNLGQPQYGDVTKVDKFMKATKMEGGTFGPEVPRVGPGRPSGGDGLPQPGAQGPNAPAGGAQQQPAPSPYNLEPHHETLVDTEAEAKAELLRWQQRASDPGAGPATRVMLALAQREYEKVARALRNGSPYYNLDQEG